MHARINTEFKVAIEKLIQKKKLNEFAPYWQIYLLYIYVQMIKITQIVCCYVY